MHVSDHGHNIRYKHNVNMRLLNFHTVFEQKCVLCTGFDLCRLLNINRYYQFDNNF